MPDDAEKLKAKRDRINARLRALKGREKRDARTMDNRKKILAGAFLLEQAKRNPAVNDWMLRGFAWFLTRPEERALFALTPQLVTDKGEGQAPAADMPPEIGHGGT